MGQGTDFFVGRLCMLAKLFDIAQNGNFSALLIAKHPKGRGHRCRGGVVTIVDDGNAASVYKLHPAVCRDVSTQGLGGVLQGNAVLQTCGAGKQGIGYIVLAGESQSDRRFFLAVYDGEGETVSASVYIGCIKVRFRSQPNGNQLMLDFVLMMLQVVYQTLLLLQLKHLQMIL